jgi:hypothetical protein
VSLTESSPSAAVRSRLKHSVIDADGHSIESLPTFLDYFKAGAVNRRPRAAALPSSTGRLRSKTTAARCVTRQGHAPVVMRARDEIMFSLLRRPAGRILRAGATRQPARTACAIIIEAPASSHA